MGLLLSHDHLMQALMSLVEVGESDVIAVITTMITTISQYQDLRLVVLCKVT